MAGVSSQWSHTPSSTPGHLLLPPWSLDICSTQGSPVHRVQMHGASNRDTHLYPPLSNSSVHLTTTTYVRRSGRITSGTRSGRTTPQDSAFSSRHRHPWPVLSRFDRFRLIGPRAKGGSALLLTNANLHFLSKLLVYSTGQARNQLGSPGGAKSIVLARNSSVF